MANRQIIMTGLRDFQLKTSRCCRSRSAKVHWPRALSRPANLRALTDETIASRETTDYRRDRSSVQIAHPSHEPCLASMPTTLPAEPTMARQDDLTRNHARRNCSTRIRILTTNSLGKICRQFRNEYASPCSTSVAPFLEPAIAEEFVTVAKKQNSIAASKMARSLQ